MGIKTKLHEGKGWGFFRPFSCLYGKGLVFIRLYSGHGKMLPKNRTAKKRRRGIRQPVFSILFLFFGVLFAVSVVILAKHLIESGQEKQAFTDLAMTAAQAQQAEEIAGLFGLVSNVPKPQQTATEPDPAAAEEQAGALPCTEYAPLYEENSDFAGWLHIDNTGIDYPVMFTPDEPEYYLRRAFDQTSSQSGTPFISEGCTPDSDFYIIYGHNMKNDTMFGTLDYYAKKAFWGENPQFSFTTVTEQREYEVFAALKTRVLYQDETGYRYYFQVGDLTEEAFDELVRWFQQNALYDTGITPAYGEQIVVLSTCSYHEDNGRFLIAARRMDSAAQKAE